jgi:hypothetical protein
VGPWAPGLKRRRGGRDWVGLGKVHRGRWVFGTDGDGDCPLGLDGPRASLLEAHVRILAQQQLLAFWPLRPCPYLHFRSSLYYERKKLTDTRVSLVAFTRFVRSWICRMLFFICWIFLSVYCR